MRPGARFRTIPAMIRDKSAKKIDKEPAKPLKGVIAVTPPSFRRERALIKRWVEAGAKAE